MPESRHVIGFSMDVEGLAEEARMLSRAFASFADALDDARQDQGTLDEVVGHEIVRKPVEFALPEHEEAVARGVLVEVRRQGAKWGEQNHRSVNPDRLYGVWAWDAALLRTRVEERVKDGSLSWLDILLEEVGEAVEAARQLDGSRDHGVEAVVELQQVAAVAISWAASILRNGE